MRIAVAEIRDDVAGYLQEVLSSIPQYIGDTEIKRAVMASTDEVTPLLPNSWHDNESKKVVGLIIEPPTVAPANLAAGTNLLPTDCLEVGDFDLNEVNQRAFTVYSKADFAARKARMGRLPVPGLFEMVFYQEGRNLRYWYLPTTTKTVEMSYIPRCADPANNGGYFLIAERARPLIVSHAAATLKLKDLKPEDYKVLWENFYAKFQLAVSMQYQKIMNDPFVRRGQPVIPVGGQQGNQ
jgi:hypothetical protein